MIRSGLCPVGASSFSEAGAESLAREIEEEIGCGASIGPVRFVIENFFELGGRKAHEIGFYFDAELSRPLRFHESDIIHRSRDGETDLEFRWILPMREALEEIDLKPAPIRALIEANPTGVRHLVYRDE
ncbi:NUDIX hydrolase [Rhizobium yanglingense]